MDLNNLSFEQLSQLQEQFENGEFQKKFDKKKEEETRKQQRIEEETRKQQRIKEEIETKVMAIKEKGALNHYSNDAIVNDLINEFKKISSIDIYSIPEGQVLDTMIKKYSLEFILLYMSSLGKTGNIYFAHERMPGLLTIINQLSFKRLEKLGFPENEIINLETLYPTDVLNYALFCNNINVSQLIDNITEYFPTRIEENERHRYQIEHDDCTLDFICQESDYYDYYIKKHNQSGNVFPYLKLSFKNIDMEAIYNYDYCDKGLSRFMIEKREKKEKELGFPTAKVNITENSKQKINNFLKLYYANLGVEIFKEGEIENNESSLVSGLILPLATNNDGSEHYYDTELEVFPQTKYYLGGHSEHFSSCQGVISYHDLTDDYNLFLYINEEEREFVSNLIDDNYQKRKMMTQTCGETKHKR